PRNRTRLSAWGKARWPASNGWNSVFQPSSRIMRPGRPPPAELRSRRPPQGEFVPAGEIDTEPWREDFGYCLDLAAKFGEISPAQFGDFGPVEAGRQDGRLHLAFEDMHHLVFD